MKVLPLLLLSGVLALTACADKGVNVSGSNISSTPEVSKLNLNESFPVSEQYLKGTWQLKDSELKGSDNKPLTLNFNNGQVSVLNGCNNIRASYAIEHYQLKVGSPISTRMMCEPNLMQIDNLATKLLAGKVGLEKFVDGLPEHSYLKITVDGKDYKFSRVK